MICVDMPSADNVADVKTRPDDVWSEEEVRLRRRASWKSLELAWRAWEKWPGEDFFDRRDACFEIMPAWTLENQRHDEMKKNHV